MPGALDEIFGSGGGRTVTREALSLIGVFASQEGSHWTNYRFIGDGRPEPYAEPHAPTAGRLGLVGYPEQGLSGQSAA
jgi:hypothetical protein